MGEQIFFVGGESSHLGIHVFRPRRHVVELLAFMLLVFILQMPRTAVAYEPSSPVLSAAEIDYPPFSIVDETGRADGFSVELLCAALTAMGLDVTFRKGPWGEVKGWLEQGDVQVLPLVGRTPEREELFDFTVPYMSLARGHSGALRDGRYPGPISRGGGWPSCAATTPRNFCVEKNAAY